MEKTCLPAGRGPAAIGKGARTALAGAVAMWVAACGGSGGGDTPSPEASDPLLGYQWYLKNDGQDALAGLRPVAGVDLGGVPALHDAGVRGGGVVVAVVDDGLDGRHEDLAPNVVPHGGHNFLDGSDDPTPSLAAGNATDDAHGTGVAGLIAMRGWNGKGGRGIAPEARLRGFNLLAVQDDGTGDQGQELFALGEGNEKAADVGVFNMSYGSDGVVLPEDIAEDVLGLERVLASTRGGKGGVYVRSAGNQFSSSEGHPDAACEDAARFNVGCFDTATDPEVAASGLVVVAAVNAAGQRSSYSSEGAAIWVSGLGGEYNYHADFAKDWPQEMYGPSLLSTDWAGCQVGYHNDLPGTTRSNAVNNGSASTIDPACGYTMFNGTSAAAPTVSGIAALMLQVRPALTARDVRYILATTARNDTWKSGLLSHPARRTAGGREFDPGWRGNAAGLRFSRWFGYGLVDAQAAVALARTFAPLPALAEAIVEVETSGDPHARIPFGGAAGDTAAAHMVAEVDDEMVVEAVHIGFESSHPLPAQLLVTLVSPRGTRVPVLVPYTSLTPVPDGVDAAIVSVNGLLGESARGAWRLEVVDVSQPATAGDTGAVLTDFNIRIQGHVAAAR